MATTTTANRLTWCDYYHLVSSRDGEEKRMIDEGLSSMNAINKAMIGKETELLNAVTNRPGFSFLLVPGPGRTVNILHCCSNIEEVGDNHLIGILGTKFSSPKKSVVIKSLTDNFQVPKATRGSNPKIPSMKKFMEATSAAEFSKLTGNDDDEDLSYIKDELPAAFFLPPQLFISDGIGPTMRADNLTAKIILLAANGYNVTKDGEQTASPPNEAESVPSSLKDARQVIIFL
jgi:hypothetical protein